MALFDRTSLVQIPSGYKEGKLYNIKPFDQPFEFERGSAATRVNEDGLIEYVGIGEELVTDGGFDDASAWTTGSNWSVENSVAISDGSTNGQIFQANIFEGGETYLVDFTVTKTGGNGVIARAYYGSYETIISVTESGTYSTVFTANASTNGNLYFISSGLFEGSIDNVSVKKISNDTPRIDYTNGKALLLEPERTNLVTYSEDFSEWSLGTGGISIYTGYLAPDGSNNATKVTRDTNFSNTALALNLGLGTTETRTIYARTVSGTGQAHLCSYNGNTNNLFTITEEWQRFEVNGAISTGAVSLYAVDFRGSTDLNEIIIWGAQAEDGSYATSYIPTNGQTETRLQDVCYGGGDESTFNDSEGTIFGELNIKNNINSSQAFITLTNGNINKRIVLYHNGSDSFIFFIDGLGNVAQISENDLDNRTIFKFAVKYKNGDNALFINGSKIGTTNTSNIIDFDGLSEFSFQNPNGANKYEGSVKALTYLPEALTDTELQELTTI